jgi:hypothetical protein
MSMGLNDVFNWVSDENFRKEYKSMI